MLGKAAAAVRTFGPIGGALYLLDRLLARAGNPARLFVYDLMVQPVAAKPFLSPRMSKLLEIRNIEQGDPAFSQMPRPPEIIAHHVAQPTVCLGAFLRGELAGFMWLCLGPYEEDEVRCTYVPTPSESAVFDFDFYVFPAHRNGLVFVRLWDAANEFLRDRSVRYSFSRLTRFNLDSKRAHQHFGWKRVGQAIFIRLDGIQIMFANIAPFVHLCGARSPGPRLKLKPDALVQDS